MRAFIVLALFMCQQFFLFAQGRIDSLEKVLPSLTDTQRVKTLNDLANEYWRVDPARAISTATEALELSREHSFLPGEGKAKNNLGTAYYIQGRYEEGLRAHSEALSIWKQLNDKRGQAASLINIGIIHTVKGDYDNALSYLLKGTKLYEELEDLRGMGNAYTNIGMVYVDKGDRAKGLSYHEKAREIFMRTGNKTGLAASLNNIGIIFDDNKDYRKALEYYHASLKLKEELGMKNGVANTLNNTGVCYFNLKEYGKSLDYCFRAEKLFDELGELMGLTVAYKYLGGNYLALKEYDKAESYFTKALALSQQIGANHSILLAYEDIASVNFAKGEYRKAYDALENAYNFRDSIFSKESEEAIAELQTRFDTEKKEKQIELLTKDALLRDAQLNRKNTLIYSFTGGILLISALAFFIYRGYSGKKRANILLQQQKQEIEKANTDLNTANVQISEKNKEITDSINYAKRIQEAILPGKGELASLLPHSFILYLPKDIVSGDFYWFAQKDNKVLVAAADCTGHGVPGALMSMIGNDKLHHVITEKGVTVPGNVLKELDQRLITVLNQDEASANKDGMDVALLSIDTYNRTVSFAGANRPLYHFSKNGLSEVKGTKLPVAGGVYGSKEFVTHSINAVEGDTFYIFSDGFADQFGGENGKKLTTNRFKQLLADIQPLTMEEQLEELSKRFTEWRGSCEQLDDVLVIGIRC